MNTQKFRFANESDCALILEFINLLAEYEKMTDHVVATEELLKEWIFEKRKAEVIFALEDGVEVGFALFFNNFSTFNRIILSHYLFIFWWPRIINFNS